MLIVESQDVLPLLSPAVFAADEWFVGGKAVSGAATVHIYSLKGWDTGSNASVYWLSTGMPNLSPGAMIPALVGALINARVLGVTTV